MKRMKAGMKVAVAAGRPPQRAHGPRIRRPYRRVGLADSESSHAESETDSSSEDDSHHSSDGDGDAVLPGPGHGHGERWGRPRWRIATLRGGGWGAVCMYHSFSGCAGRKCQKSVRDARFSDEEQRRLMKAWLLAGLGIDSDAEFGQQDHVHGVDISTLSTDLRAEADLDADMVAAVVALGEDSVM